MKKLFSLLLALVMVVCGLEAQATLTNSNATAQNGNVLLYNALITATSNDTTTSALSNPISNLDGSIKDVCAGVMATNQTGSSPTLTVSFMGAFSSTGPYFDLTTAQASTAGTTGTMASPALGISTASTTNVATGVCMSAFGRGGANALLPPYLKVKVAVGGTGTPGWTGYSLRSGKTIDKGLGEV